MARELVPIGVIARPHGVRGELRLHLYDEESEALDGAERIALVRRGSEPEMRVLKHARRVPGAYLLTLDGIADRNAADTLRGVEVCAYRADLPALEDGEFYVADLVGLPAFARDGRALGTVIEIVRTPAHDLAVLHHGELEIMIPVIDQFVVSVAADRVVFDPPEGLPEEPIQKQR